MFGTKTADIEELKRLMTQKDCTELKKLIVENPELPLLIFVGEESNSGEYTYESVDGGYTCIKELTMCGEYWVEKEEYADKVKDEMCDDEQYATLSDSDFDAAAENIVNNTAFIKAIVIYVG